jgi:hypothetical protein
MDDDTPGMIAYSIWCTEMNLQGVNVDPWEDISHAERSAWEAVGKQGNFTEE